MNNKEQDNYSNATLDLIKKFVDSNQRKRINSLTQIESEVENIFNLGPSLFDMFDREGDDWAAGWILQVLKKFKPEFFENSKFNNWFNTYSDIDINYEDLQLMLVEQKFEDAKDLETIDRLWTIYSTGRFGFSIQAKILKSVGKKYELMWPKIGWKKEGLWTRYPGSFCWSLDAPDGHMPLINQLRGVRLMDSILRHPAISKRHNNIL